jgi:hypothetical protein
LRLRRDRDWIYLLEGDWIIFPPINEGDFALGSVEGKIWSDFPEWKPEGLKSKFLDYEYIYDPKAFLSMEGGNWAVFRKNCRKWPKRFGNHLTYERISAYPFRNTAWGREELDDVLGCWLESKLLGKKIEDEKILIQYLRFGENRKVLWDSNQRIYGVNVWDENYKYINFRYCICRPEEYLSEYMRFLFYTDPYIQSQGKLVNDGGVLDNPDLKRFKDKMNPLQVREVKSWFAEGI